MRKHKKLLSFKVTLIIFIIIVLLAINKAWEASNFQAASLENGWNLISLTPIIAGRTEM